MIKSFQVGKHENTRLNSKLKDNKHARILDADCWHDLHHDWPASEVETRLVMETEINGQTIENPRILVMFSGGACSWAAAKRAAEKYGTQNMTLLFADTKIEEPSLYKFLDEAADNIGAPLIKIADGRTPFEVFKDVRFLGNSRVDPCSRVLKRDLLNKYREEHFDPADTITVFGMDYNEPHRLKKVQKMHAPWVCEAPMTERPALSKERMLEMVRQEGLTICDLYKDGFPHANCGGGCIKAGIAQFTNLLKKRPETFKRWEQEEQEIRTMLNKDVSILKDRRGGTAKPLTLEQLRERIEVKNEQLTFDEMCDWGGCGCAVD